MASRQISNFSDISGSTSRAGAIETVKHSVFQGESVLQTKFRKLCYGEREFVASHQIQKSRTHRLAAVAEEDLKELVRKT